MRAYRVNRNTSAGIRSRPTLYQTSAAAQSIHSVPGRVERLQGKQSCLCEISAAAYPIPRPSRKLHRCMVRRRDVSGKPQRHDDLPCTRSRTARTKTCAAVISYRSAESPRAAPSGGACTGEIEAKDGLPSADRNNKATLLLTGPFRTAKSSAKDLTPLVLKLQYAKYHDALRAPWRIRLLRR